MRSKIIIIVLIGLYIFTKPGNLYAQAIDVTLCPMQEIEVSLEETLIQPQHVYQWQISADEMTWDNIQGEDQIKCTLESGNWGSQLFVRCLVTDTLSNPWSEQYSATSHIAAYSEPAVDYANISGLCFGAQTIIELSDPSVVNTSEVTWNVEGEVFYQGYPFETRFSDAGLYHIYANITTSDGGCPYTLDSTVIEVHPPSELSLQGSERVCLNQNYGYSIIGNSEDCSYVWNVTPDADVDTTHVNVDYGLQISYIGDHQSTSFVNISVTEFNNTLGCVSGKLDKEVLVSEFSAPPKGDIIKKGNGLLIYVLPASDPGVGANITYDDYTYNWRTYNTITGETIPLDNDDAARHYFDFGNIAKPFDSDIYQYLVEVGYKNAKLDCYQTNIFEEEKNVSEGPVLKAFPNPSSNGFVDVSLVNAEYSGTNVDFILYDSFGRVIESILSSGLQNRFNLSDVNPGLYLIVGYQSNEPVATKKIMISK
jgi:hypothetical protein